MKRQKKYPYGSPLIGKILVFKKASYSVRDDLEIQRWTAVQGFVATSRPGLGTALAAAGAAVHWGITEQLDRPVNSRPCGETVCLGCAWTHGRTTATCNHRQTSGTVRVALKAKRDAIVFARHRPNQRQARCCTSHPPIRAGSGLR